MDLEAHPLEHADRASLALFPVAHLVEIVFQQTRYPPVRVLSQTPAICFLAARPTAVPCSSAAKRGRKMFSALRAFHNGNRNVTNFVTK